jgi:hypothetical protein
MSDFQQKDATREQEGQQRAALRGRLKRFYNLFNQRAWDKCYEYLDPRLRQPDKVNFALYAQSLGNFAEHYGDIESWHTDISLHLDASRNKQDPRPFAYVYVFWQDKRHAFHVFRERWVREAGSWYTRVVGLVTHEAPADEARLD